MQIEIKTKELVKKASNNQIKLLRKLAQKKYREKEGLFIVEGERAIDQFLSNGKVQLKSIFVDETVSDFKNVIQLFNDLNEVFTVESNTLNELADTENPQGILALAKMPTETPINEMAKQVGLIVAVDRLQDPGNLGTIIRTAAWFGCKGLLLGKGSVDIFHPKVVRSTVGATGVLAHYSSNLEHDLEELEQVGWHICFLDGNEGAKPIQTIPNYPKIVVVIGNEANGVNSELFSKTRTRALIPTTKANRSVESLNAAVAAAIGLYELASKSSE